MRGTSPEPADTGPKRSVRLPGPRTPTEVAPAVGLPASNRAAVAARAVGVGAAYAALSSVVTLVTSFGTEIGAVFWPGAGLTVAALLLTRRAEWAAILSAVFVAEVALDLTVGDFGVPAALAFGVANCLEPLVATLLLHRFGCSRVDLGKMRDLLAFAGAAVIVGPSAGALVGTALPALMLGDPWFPRLPRWILGDGVGVLVVAPLLLTYRRAQDVPARRSRPALLALLAVAVAVAGPWAPSARAGLEYVLVPSLVFLAVHLRSAGAARGVAIVAAVVETFSAASHGPFTAASGLGIAAGQMFLAMTGLCALAVAALTNDLVARERAEARLRMDALHDALTGVGNRRLLEERITHALERIRRYPDNGLAVFSVDLDEFKDINDRHGHAAGDAVLVEVARRLTETVRTGDTVCRPGGDEFVVLAEDLADPEGAEALAHRLGEELRRPMAWRGVTLSPSASIGWAMSRGSPEVRADELLAEADTAMYAAKQAARPGHVRPAR
jgi:diguanylate cyclase (GGDEF)-like protein